MNEEVEEDSRGKNRIIERIHSHDKSTLRWVGMLQIGRRLRVVLRDFLAHIRIEQSKNGHKCRKTEAREGKTKRKGP